MKPSMHRQSPAVHKSLPAGRTLEGSLSGMPSPVNHQIATAGEVLPANLALIRPDALVRSLDVGLEVLVVPIGSLADVTLEWTIRLRRWVWSFAGRITPAFFLVGDDGSEGGRRRGHNGRERRKAHIGAGVHDRFLDWQLGFGLLLVGRFGIGFL